MFFAIWRVWESKKLNLHFAAMDSLRKETRIPSFPKIISRFRFWPKRAIAMEISVETSPMNWQKNIWWNSPSRLHFFFVREIRFGWVILFHIFDEIWCSTYVDPVTWVWPPKSSSRMKWREQKIEAISELNDTEIEGSFAFGRESWSVNCLFESFWALLCRRLCESWVRVTGRLLCVANE